MNLMRDAAATNREEIYRSVCDRFPPVRASGLEGFGSGKGWLRCLEALVFEGFGSGKGWLRSLEAMLPWGIWCLTALAVACGGYNT